MNDKAVSELFLASVLARPVIDSRGGALGRLEDLVMVPGARYPEVSHLLVRRGRRTFSVPWREVSLFNPVVISVGSPAALSPYEPGEGEILVKRDILDKQVVDVNGARVLRVNDLKLGSLDRSLCVFSADVGFRGLLRRLGYERLGDRVSRVVRRPISDREIRWEYLQPIQHNAARLALTIAREQLSELHPADLAEIISQIPSQDAPELLTTVDPETAGEAIHELDRETVSRVISQMDSEKASDIVEEMAPDEAADVLAEVPEEKAQEILGHMAPEDAEEIQELMGHEEDTAGGLMNSEFIALSPGMTVGEALAQVRLLAPDIETVYYSYVLDEEDRPLGVVSLKQLLVQRSDLPLEQAMRTSLKTVGLSAGPEEILDVIAKYDLVAVPVLDGEGKMAGIVTVEDILELFLPYALKRKRNPQI